MNFDVRLIAGLTADSRKVQKDFLFVAMAGAKTDGRQFIADAVAKGAKFIAVQTGTPQQDIGTAQWLEVENPQMFLAQSAAAFYKKQPKHIIAVTGTNGKTSTVNFARMIWEALHVKAASLGTLGLIGQGLEGYAGMTTPDPVFLFSTLSDVAGNHIDHLAMEASSHGLHQHRLDGVMIQAAGFTNLTRDHLDYHGSMDDYLQAKLRLFTDILAPQGTAVLNADIHEFEKIKAVATARRLPILSYGFSNGADIRIVERMAVADGQNLKLDVRGKNYNIHLNLVGAFQAMNVLCAAGLVLAGQEFTVDEVMSVLPQLQGVAGRLQPVPHSLKNIGVYVDYAHTPDGLETILAALRPHTAGRLICVFGCGGDRDKGKRPVMGEIANRLSDIAIVTDDNPRSEDPAVIRAEIMAGAPDATEIAGRRNAIQSAVQYLQAGDILVVAGKGHEQGQIFATYTEPFDDLTEIQTALSHFFQ